MEFLLKYLYSLSDNIFDFPVLHLGLHYLFIHKIIMVVTAVIIPFGIFFPHITEVKAPF